MASLRRSLEKLMVNAPKIAEEIKLSTEDVKKVFTQAMNHAENNKRKPAPPPPEGGISQSEGSRKYGVRQENISRWVSKGYIPVLLRTNREVYVDEAALAELVKRYQQDPGQGKKTIKLSEQTTWW